MGKVLFLLIFETIFNEIKIKGGFPYWLMRENPHMKIRTKDPEYIKYVDKWLNYLLPKVKPFLYENGGPVIMVQIENEYGFMSCDFEYTTHLRDVFRENLGDNILLFTTDGGKDDTLKCGKIEGVYATVDFGVGANVEAAFEAQKRHQQQGPAVCSEYWPGWFDEWGESHRGQPTDKTCHTLDQALAHNASVNMWVILNNSDYAKNKLYFKVYVFWRH